MKNLNDKSEGMEIKIFFKRKNTIECNNKKRTRIEEQMKEIDRKDRVKTKK